MSVDKTGPWQSENGEPFLTKEGFNALKSYSLRQDIFKPFCCMQFYQEDLKNLKINDMVIGPAFNTKNRFGVFQLKNGGKFVMINQNEMKPDDVKLIRDDVMIHDGSWFSWRGELYFASHNLNNIEKLSIYFTPKGLDYLLTKRQNYLYVRDNVHLFGANQLKGFKQIPRHKDWW